MSTIHDNKRSDVLPLLGVHVDMAWVSPAGPMVNWSGDAGMWNEFEVAVDEAGEALEMGEF